MRRTVEGITVAQALRRYENKAKHLSIALGFTLDGKVYVISLNELKTRWCCWEKNSKKKGGKWKIRMHLTYNDKVILAKRAGCVLLGTYDEIFADLSKANRGEIFEKLLFEAITHKAWQKDDTPYWEGADIEYNGMMIQVKYDGCSVCSLASIKN